SGGTMNSGSSLAAAGDAVLTVGEALFGTAGCTVAVPLGGTNACCWSPPGSLNPTPVDEPEVASPIGVAVPCEGASPVPLLDKSGDPTCTTSKESMAAEPDSNLLSSWKNTSRRPTLASTSSRQAGGAES